MASDRRVWCDVVKVLSVPKAKRVPGQINFALELACGNRVGRQLIRPAGVGPDRVPCRKCTEAKR